MIYTANRDVSDRDVAVRYPNGDITELTPTESQGIINHSPDGFNWGYGGSGPAQLALALLLHATGNRKLATRYYQDFKWEVIAHLPDAWEIAQEKIVEWIEHAKGNTH